MFLNNNVIYHDVPVAVPGQRLTEGGDNVSGWISLDANCPLHRPHLQDTGTAWTSLLFP